MPATLLNCSRETDFTSKMSNYSKLSSILLCNCEQFGFFSTFFFLMWMHLNGTVLLLVWCRRGPAGVTAPAQPCVWEGKQRIGLNNVRNKGDGKAGAGESAAWQLLPGKREAHHWRAREIDLDNWTFEDVLLFHFFVWSQILPFQTVFDFSWCKWIITSTHNKIGDRPLRGTSKVKPVWSHVKIFLILIFK